MIILKTIVVYFIRICNKMVTENLSIIRRNINHHCNMYKEIIKITYHNRSMWRFISNSKGLQRCHANRTQRNFFSLHHVYALTDYDSIIRSSSFEFLTTIKFFQYSKNCFNVYLEDLHINQKKSWAIHQRIQHVGTFKCIV